MLNYILFILLTVSTIGYCRPDTISDANYQTTTLQKNSSGGTQSSEFDMPLTKPEASNDVVKNKMNTALCSKKDLTKILFLPFFYFIFQEIVILLHECGHAAVTKMFNPNANPQIYMWYNMWAGGNLAEGDFVNICGIRFKKNIFSKDFSFFTGCTAGAQNENKWKNVGILLAGGTTTLIIGYLVLVANAIRLKYTETQNLSEAIKFGFTNTFTPYKNLFLNKKQSKLDLVVELVFISIVIETIIESLLYTYFPTFSGADGSRVWGQIFKGDKQEICIPNIIPEFSGQEIFSKVIIAIILIALAYKATKTYEEYFNASTMDQSKDILDEIEVVPQN